MSPQSHALPPLALLDWGIGGLSVRAALAKERPGIAVTYVSDSGYTPYGLLSASKLQTRLSCLVEGLAARGVRRVFFACNAASTALDQGAGFAVPVSGMIAAGVAAVAALQAGHVGVVAGRRTVQSGAYRKRLLAQGMRITQRIAQPLSGAIERGDCDTEDTRQLVRRIVAPLARVDVVLLACTHYPAAMPAFRAALPGMLFVDPAAEAARSLLHASRASDLVVGQDRVLTTGNAEAMRLGAGAAFGVALPRVGNLTLS